MVMPLNINRKTPRRPTRAKPRDEAGRFRPGFSGNPKGRPRKVKTIPKHLAEEIADAMAAKTAVTGADGKETMVSAYQAIVQQLVHSAKGAKPKEILAILEAMDKLAVFSVMRQNAEPPPEIKVSEEDLALLAILKASLEEQRLAALLESAVSPPVHQQPIRTPPGPSAASTSPSDSEVKPRQPAKRPHRKAARRQPPGGKRAK
ncbi:hypothetical protein GRI44_01035 [Altererythrobacter confluentis]|uniref:DUF5681 domain-containing protein n=1 Tax=Allopontixanthobacter confluentis TaxID=1849021 RepID=A0A6L7GCJ0_9SPHN|nr:DUF5681 domain-containing protein [Allopontixanthobacter confluentis]MXP13340.1 hypothetical protein [Allopontixanthobacter confluentis]